MFCKYRGPDPVNVYAGKIQPSNDPIIALAECLNIPFLEAALIILMAIPATLVACYIGLKCYDSYKRGGYDS
jgi:hypothetical protein